MFHDVPTLQLWRGLRAPQLKPLGCGCHAAVTFAQARKAIALGARWF
jgi:hypothetical protein